MNPLVTPMTPEEKAKFEAETGLVPYTPVKAPNYCNPNHISYHLFNLPIIAASLAGYYYAPKLHMPRTAFAVSLALVPIFYAVSLHHKEKRYTYDSGPRKTLEEHLEFYPITRRAWNRAVTIREAEIEEIKARKATT
ncbi:unnamed protein product [Moneuplotes crassus]|uniref:Uncharacterized protein n=1 Tax=Euplotes crassus TaxID=5936 RepID=A0AAD2D8G5_EUPCR|nr:unnamed protein product [Moneuplotes crassus]